MGSLWKDSVDGVVVLDWTCVLGCVGLVVAGGCTNCSIGEPASGAIDGCVGAGCMDAGCMDACST